MIALIQRVTHASVTMNGERVAAIGTGMLVLLGIVKGDAHEDADYLARKTAALRIFNDHAGVPNFNASDTGAEVLVVSQFTLCADTRKGNRPSFANAAPPVDAERLYGTYVAALRSLLGAEKIHTGMFRAMMNVELVNDGPYTVWVESNPASKHNRVNE